MVYFERGSSALSRDAARILDRQADTLHQYPSVSIQLVGHADSVEAPSSRQMGMLAQNRAAAARDYLIYRSNIDANRLVAVGRDYSPVIVRNESERILAVIRHVRSELLR